MSELLLSDDGEDLIYEVEGDAVRGNPLDIVTVATCYDCETVDGVKFDAKQTVLRMKQAWNSYATLTADLARVTAERDKLRAACSDASVVLDGYERGTGYPALAHLCRRIREALKQQ